MNILLSSVIMLVAVQSLAIAEDRIPGCENLLIFVEAQIDSKPVRLALDTGSRCNALFRESVRRLDLKPGVPTQSSLALIGNKKVQVTTNCTLAFWKKEQRDTQFVILDGPPGGAIFDGLVCWSSLRQSIFSFDWTSRSARIHSVRPDVMGWDEVILKEQTTAIASDSSENSGLIYIDTGSEFGIDLSLSKWTEWKRNNPSSPKTLTAYWTYDDGIGSCEQYLSKEIRIGNLRFNNVIIQQGAPPYSSIPNFSARIGLNALRQFEIVIDGPEHRMFMKRRPDVPVDERYNRLGAVFIPSTGTMR